MNGRSFPALLAVLAMLLSPSLFAQQDSNAIKEMAQIVKNLNHRPSAGDQQVLRGIVSADAATPGERAIANALLQMNHQVGGADREKLRALSDDKAASSAERELAEIVMGINHQASSRDKERLDRL